VCWPGCRATASRGDRPGEAKVRALLEVFRDRPEDILRFVDDLTIPPTSNDAERGLRPSKIQQNISGRLTSIPRTETATGSGATSPPPRNTASTSSRPRSTCSSDTSGYPMPPPSPDHRRPSEPLSRTGRDHRPVATRCHRTRRHMIGVKVDAGIPRVPDDAQRLTCGHELVDLRPHLDDLDPVAL
jgi:hypothetical protein